MKKPILFTITAVLLFSISFNSCDKDPFTEPAVVKFEFNFYDDDKKQLKNTDVSPQLSLFFNKGYITVTSVKFEGYREEGDNVYFTSDFDYKVDDLVQINNPSLEFDIPQGIYNHIKLSITMDTVSGYSALSIGGVCKETNTTKPIKEYEFEYKLKRKEIISLTAENIDSSNTIVIEKGDPSIVEVRLDPIYLFYNVYREFSSSNTEIGTDGYVYSNNIIITADTNDAFYAEINKRLEDAFSAVFK
jgi:hypothetical protein